MIQTENTAIVLRRVHYRENDRMVTLLSPSRGRMEAVIRNCRKPKSHNLNASELFALGDYMVVESGGRMTVTSVRLIETFYPLRTDYTRLTCAVWLLGLAEAAAEPEQEQQELFMLLLHTLSRLAFSDQPWKPLLSGFLLHFSACQGFKPRLNHCVLCGKSLGEVGSASWVNTPDAMAPFTILRAYVEGKLGRRLKSGAMLPQTEPEEKGASPEAPSTPEN